VNGVDRFTLCKLGELLTVKHFSNDMFFYI